MTLIERGREPSGRDLRLFGLVFLAVFAIVGTMLGLRAGAWQAARVLWLGALLVSVIYYSVATLRRPIYLLWMTVLYPLAWFVSHVLLAVVYYGVMTPIGMVLRLFGRDVLQQKRHTAATTYWIPLATKRKASRYLRPF